jgi:ribosomal protein S27AE
MGGVNVNNWFCVACKEGGHVPDVVALKACPRCGSETDLAVRILDWLAKERAVAA